jgi:hypothetical protein
VAVLAIQVEVVQANLVVHQAKHLSVGWCRTQNNIPGTGPGTGPGIEPGTGLGPGTGPGIPPIIPGG